MRDNNVANESPIRNLGTNTIKVTTLLLIGNVTVLILCFIYLFILGCAGSLLLRRHFSSCGERGLLSSCSAQASHCGGFSCRRAQALGHIGSNSSGSQALEPGISSRGAWA